MNSQNSLFSRLFLRYASPLAGLRRLPVFGSFAGWVSAKLMPRGTLTWMQVRSGPGQGLWLLLNSRTGLEYFQGAVEPQVQMALQEYLRPGMTFYDIGANIGFFSLLAARLVGESGKVFSFEVDAKLVNRFRANVAANGFQNVSLHEKAVWKETLSVPFVRANAAVSPDLGLGHVDLSATRNDTVGVPAVSLDDFIRGASAPDFIKCDAEGAEVEIFRGARNLLAQSRPIILCELHSEENRRTLVEFWSSHGFSCQPWSQCHVLALPQ